jgi:hypothetical protein
VHVPANRSSSFCVPVTTIVARTKPIRIIELMIIAKKSAPSADMMMSSLYGLSQKSAL